MIDIDPEIQMVLCTAYADYTLRDIVGRLKTSDRLLFMRKPFDTTAAHLLAIALTEKWRLNREMASVVEQQGDSIVNLERVVEMIEIENSELMSNKEKLENHSNELSLRLQQRTVEILGTRDVTVFALAQLAESRDPETGDHLKRMREYAQLLAEHLASEGPYVDEIDEEFLSDFYRSTPLHDIGKVGIPDKILLKPGALTVQEFDIMKRHTLIGAEALEKAARISPFGGFLHMAANVARYHHERYDGSGYPVGLRGNQIPLVGRIAALADVFDALTSNRVYRGAMPIEQARQIIEQDSGTHFDPVVVEAFRFCFDDFLEIKQAIDCEQENMADTIVYPLVPSLTK
jgi:putative two-component system response regulator